MELERARKCKKFDTPVCHPDVKFLASPHQASRPIYTTEDHFHQAEEACEKCKHYEEKK